MDSHSKLRRSGRSTYLVVSFAADLKNLNLVQWQKRGAGFKIVTIVSKRFTSYCTFCVKQLVDVDPGN